MNVDTSVITEGVPSAAHPNAVTAAARGAGARRTRLRGSCEPSPVAGSNAQTLSRAPSPVTLRDRVIPSLHTTARKPCTGSATSRRHGVLRLAVAPAPPLPPSPPPRSRAFLTSLYAAHGVARLLSSHRCLTLSYFSSAKWPGWGLSLRAFR